MCKHGNSDQSLGLHSFISGPEVYKTFSMLTSAKHETFPAYKC